MIRSASGFFLLLNFAFVFYGNASPQQEDGKPKFIIFSGSDWCLPCIRLERQVFSTDVFQEFAQENLDLIQADFPQRKKLEESQIVRNESLAEQYNPSGEFPKLCLVVTPGSMPIYFPASYSDPQSIISDIKKHLNPKQVYRRKLILMGSAFEFALVHEDSNSAEELLDLCVSETQRLESILSEWQDSSEVSEIIRKAGKASVAVSPELFGLTQRCVEISRITQGAFDISFRGVDVWRFDGRELEKWPATELIQRQISTVGFEKIELIEPNRIKLQQENMAIGFGAVGKGYAADYLKQLLISKGVSSGVINASGDLTTWGKRADGTDWNVGITNPNVPDGLLFGMKFSDRSIATSGSYEKYFTYQGKRYAHIIDPTTGLPISDKKSVSVISNSAELADALATAFFVMRTEVALDLAEQIPGVSCIIIDQEDEIHTTSDIDLKQ